MGDRVLVVFKDRYGTSPALYGHWSGDSIVDVLSEAAPTMRAGDKGYALARACAALCSHVPGALSVGIHAGPKDLLPSTLKEFSHGDAGVLVVDVDTGEMTAFGGYLTGRVLPKLALYRG